MTQEKRFQLEFSAVLTREKIQEELHAVRKRSGMPMKSTAHSGEEPIYLGTGIVMSPRPGRIIERIACPFACQAGERDVGAIKSSADFALSLTWRMPQGVEV